MNTTLSHLAAHSRVWIFQADRFLTEQEAQMIKHKMNEFIPNWASHGNDLYGGFEWLDSLFLIVAVDEARSPASGCSIDSLTRVIKDLGVTLNVDFFNRLNIAYIDSLGKLDLVSMTTFKQLIREGKVTENTVVFNNLVQNREDLNEKWQTVVKNSWHTNLFELA